MIYLCRHGETEFNRDGRLQGRLESELTERGRAQAAAMGELLQGLIGDQDRWRLVASPLLRTRQTAAAIAERVGLQVEIDERLIEIGVGAWQGLLRADVAKAHPEAFADKAWCFRSPGGETYDEVLARVSSWLADQPPEPERRLIVVSHGVAGRLLRAAYAGLDPQAALDQDIPQDAVFRLQDGRMERIACANRTAEPHLPAI